MDNEDQRTSRYRGPVGARFSGLSGPEEQWVRGPVGTEDQWEQRTRGH